AGNAVACNRYEMERYGVVRIPGRPRRPGGRSGHMSCPDRSKLRRAARQSFPPYLVHVGQRERCRLNPTDRGRLLRTYPVLRDLPAHLLKKVVATATPVQATAGQRLFGDGSPCTYYPLLIEGIIRASKVSPEGHEILLYRLNPGESCVITVVTLLGE